MKTLATVVVVAALWVVPQSGATATLASSSWSAQTLGVGIPDTLAAGAQGATTTGANATSAATSLNDPKASPVSFSSLLVVQSATARNQTARLVLTGATGLANLTQMTLALGAGAQILIVSGSVTQSSGASVPLPASTSLTVSATTLQKAAKGATATLNVDVVYASATGGAGLAERWTLAIT